MGGKGGSSVVSTDTASATKTDMNAKSPAAKATTDHHWWHNTPGHGRSDNKLNPDRPRRDCVPVNRWLDSGILNMFIIVLVAAVQYVLYYARKIIEEEPVDSDEEESSRRSRREHFEESVFVEKSSADTLTSPTHPEETVTRTTSGLSQEPTLSTFSTNPLATIPVLGFDSTHGGHPSEITLTSVLKNNHPFSATPAKYICENRVVHFSPASQEAEKKHKSGNGLEKKDYNWSQSHQGLYVPGPRSAFVINTTIGSGLSTKGAGETTHSEGLAADKSLISKKEGNFEVLGDCENPKQPAKQYLARGGSGIAGSGLTGFALKNSGSSKVPNTEQLYLTKPNDRQQYNHSYQSLGQEISTPAKYILNPTVETGTGYYKDNPFHLAPNPLYSHLLPALSGKDIAPEAKVRKQSEIKENNYPRPIGDRGENNIFNSFRLGNIFSPMPGAPRSKKPGGKGASYGGREFKISGGDERGVNGFIEAQYTGDMNGHVAKGGGAGRNKDTKSSNLLEVSKSEQASGLIESRPKQPSLTPKPVKTEITTTVLNTEGTLADLLDDIGHELRSRARFGNVVCVEVNFETATDQRDKAVEAKVAHMVERIVDAGRRGCDIWLRSAASRPKFSAASRVFDDVNTPDISVATDNQWKKSPNSNKSWGALRHYSSGLLSLGHEEAKENHRKIWRFRKRGPNWEKYGRMFESGMSQYGTSSYGTGVRINVVSLEF